MSFLAPILSICIFFLSTPLESVDSKIVFSRRDYPQSLGLKYFHTDDDAGRVEFLKDITGIQKGDLFFDVGAHLGESAKVFLACGAKVICFEPQPHAISILSNNYAHNPNIVIEGMGLGAQEGVLDFFQCPETGTISSFSQDFITNSRFAKVAYTWNAPIKVPVTTLDKMIQKHGMPVFCKIDVEGYELEVITGLTRPIKLLSFEIASEFFEKSSVQVINRLVSLGYTKFNFAVAFRNEFLFDRWLPADIFIAELRKAIPDFEFMGGFWGDAYATTDR